MLIVFRVLDYLIVAYWAVLIAGSISLIPSTFNEAFPEIYIGLMATIYLLMALTGVGIVFKWLTGHVLNILISGCFIGATLFKAANTYGVEAPELISVTIFTLLIVHSLIRLTFVRPSRTVKAPPMHTVITPPVQSKPSHRRIGWDEKDSYGTSIQTESFQRWVATLDRHLEEIRLPSRHYHFNLSSIFYGHHHNLSPEDFLKSGYSRHFDPGRDGVSAPPIQEEVKELVGVASSGSVETSNLKQEPPIQDRITQLERLASLKEKGHLSPQEFEDQKRKILEGS